MLRWRASVDHTIWLSLLNCQLTHHLLCPVPVHRCVAMWCLAAARRWREPSPATASAPPTRATLPSWPCDSTTMLSYEAVSGKDALGLSIRKVTHQWDGIPAHGTCHDCVQVAAVEATRWPGVGTGVGTGLIREERGAAAHESACGSTVCRSMHPNSRRSGCSA